MIPELLIIMCLETGTVERQRFEVYPIEQMYTTEELSWLYRCVEAEETDMGYRAKYLVASCILNRLDWGNYGSTIEDVVCYPRQFEVVTNGRIETVTPTEETIKACNDAIRNREKWVVGFSQGNKHSGWAKVQEVINNEYFYRSKR